MECRATLRFIAVAAAALTGVSPGASPASATGSPARENPPSRVVRFEERLVCERSIQQVYWDHRIWPGSNPGPKPELSSVLPQPALERKVTDTLSKSAALAAIWDRPLTSEQLRAEIDHMARGTRNPKMLGELWDALGNDPALVAECLARPFLADRLARNWYARDPRFHARLRERILAEIEAHGTVAGMKALSGRYDTQLWRKAGQEDRVEQDPLESSPVRILAEKEWAAELASLRELLSPVDAADDSAPPSGKLSAIQEDDRSFYVIAVLRASSDELHLATVTWPKRSFDEWWAENKSSFPPAPEQESVSIAGLPQISQAGCAADSWSALPFVPRQRDKHVAVWTGSEMLIWGGNFVEPDNVPGGRYDPATDTWHPMNSIDPPTTRQLATAVWTGTEMIVWGGWGGGLVGNVKNTGARYDPIADSWTPTSATGAVPSARSRHTAVWTGTEMIVWGGCTTDGCATTLGTGGRYDPASDSWSPVTTASAPAERFLHTAAWTGTEMIVWGGESSTVVHDDGGRYDPAADRWTPMTTSGAPDARSLHTAVWTGSGMIVWGGCRSRGCFYPLLDTGGVYDPAADLWRPTSTTGAPYQRRYHTAVWTGSEMIVWGGCVDSDCSDFRDTGGRYDPVTDAWVPTDTTTDPGARARHTAVWTGTEMIVWGGCVGGQCGIKLTGGGRYDPTSDSWVPAGRDTAPIGRIRHSAVWTGAEMIVWGGQASTPMREGMRYDPSADRWSAVTDLGAPTERSWHTAVWSGTEMIVWGGVQRIGGLTNTGGRYDPVTDSWAPTGTSGAPSARIDHTAVWSGSEMIVWGGVDPAALNSGGRYDPATDSWMPTNVAGAPAGRFEHGSVWTGDEMIVWGGGLDYSTPTPTATGGRYSPAGNTWTPTSLSGAPGARSLHTAVWSGSEMIVWGGRSPSLVFGDGARYDPLSDAWTPVSPASAPASRHSHTASWTGSEMIVWGGENDVTQHFTGGRYDPAADTWSPTGTGAFVPFERKLHTAVWTGTEAIVWGGQRGTGYAGTGARYCPAGSQGTTWPGSVGSANVTYVGGMLSLTWDPSCSGAATDYAVYVGTIGEWTSHMPYSCTTGGAMSMTMPAGSGNEYILIVPLDANAEGSYGADSTGGERLPSAGACMQAQSLGGCQ